MRRFLSNYFDLLLYIYQMAPPQTVVITSSCCLLLIYRPWKDERLSCLSYRGWFTHISGHLSAVGRVQDSESSPVKDQRSTAVLRNQPTRYISYITEFFIPVIQQRTSGGSCLFPSPLSLLRHCLEVSKKISVYFASHQNICSSRTQTAFKPRPWPYCTWCFLRNSTSTIN